MHKKWNILFIQDEKTVLKADSTTLSQYFNKTDIARNRHQALKLIYANTYDIVINDITTDPLEGTVFIKQTKQMKPEQVQVALVLANDEEKIGGLIDAGVNTFLLTPEQLEQALDAISDMNPYLKK
ncbi:response regulator [Sulfurimonas sp. SWIR-19]|uniref:response regulator n=1 Tax=Sulfurimonas sp. SWIR-19 TaxID=2878390 RepID=UPI001CF26F16|nr:response regulator [Sulfurimonas sp. SWIR-19]UCN01497.1 response regulator [Sulfurimonas sp. SWIR-19]